MADLTQNPYYVPRQDQAPNLFNSFWAGFFKERMPLARTVFKERLAQLDPTARNAAINDLITEKREYLDAHREEWGKVQKGRIESQREVVKSLAGMVNAEIGGLRVGKRGGSGGGDGTTNLSKEGRSLENMAQSAANRGDAAGLRRAINAVAAKSIDGTLKYEEQSMLGEMLEEQSLVLAESLGADNPEAAMLGEAMNAARGHIRMAQQKGGPGSGGGVYAIGRKALETSPAGDLSDAMRRLQALQEEQYAGPGADAFLSGIDKQIARLRKTPDVDFQAPIFGTKDLGESKVEKVKPKEEPKDPAAEMLTEEDERQFTVTKKEEPAKKSGPKRKAEKKDPEMPQAKPAAHLATAEPAVSEKTKERVVGDEFLGEKSLLGKAARGAKELVEEDPYYQAAREGLSREAAKAGGAMDILRGGYGKLFYGDDESEERLQRGLATFDDDELMDEEARKRKKKKE